jgi:hypothetical protein
MPAISEAVSDKRILPRVFAVGGLLVAVAYVAMGTVLAAFFGDAVDSQCNLSWASYLGCVPRGAPGSPPPTRADASYLSRSLSFVILVFPAADVLSAFPLSAITLSNNLRSAIEGKFFGHSEEPDEALLDLAPESGAQPPRLRTRLGARLLRRLPLRQRARARLLFFRLLACLPPLLAAAASTWAGVDLGTIFAWTGTLGVLIALSVPAALRMQSFAMHEATVRSLVATVAELQEAPGLCLFASEAEADERAAAMVEEALRRPLPLSDVLLGVRQRDAWTAETPYTAAPLRLLRRLHPSAARLDLAVLVLSAVIVVGLVVVLAGGADG